jgi:hypothetical protein
MENPDVHRHTVIKKQPGPTLILTPAARILLYVIYRLIETV